VENETRLLLEVEVMPKPFHPNDLVSPAYREQLTEMHAPGQWGNKGYKHADAIIEFMSSLGDQGGQMSILDYGSGSNSFANTCHDLDIQSYDPGRPGFDEMPGPVDLVVCTDVLENIEPDLLYNVLRHIAELAQVGIYLHIATKPAKQILPDGRNAHLIVEDFDWWTTKFATISDRWRVLKFVNGSKSLTFYLVRLK
jgi:hypothetical protein